MCSDGHTTLEADALTKFLSDIIRKGERPEHYKLWWHSHNDFNVYFSHIDTQTISELSANSVLISLCINKFGDMVARKDGIGGHRRLEVVIIPKERDSLKRNCTREAKRKVNGEVILPDAGLYTPDWLNQPDFITV